jgi:hypothetical protein
MNNDDFAFYVITAKSFHILSRVFDKLETAIVIILNIADQRSLDYNIFEIVFIIF